MEMELDALELLHEEQPLTGGCTVETCYLDSDPCHITSEDLFTRR